MPPKIVILGDYSGKNTGHNALLLSIIHEFNSLVPCTFIVPTLKPALLNNVFSKGIENIVLIGIAPWNFSLKFLGLPLIRAIRAADCILLTDNLFYDSGFLNPFKNNLLALIFLTKYAQHLSKPLIYYNSGIGPVTSPWGKFCIRQIANRMNLILLRDTESETLLHEIAPKVDTLVTADSGFSMSQKENSPEKKQRPFLEKKFSRKEEWIGINLSYHILDEIRKKESRHFSDNKIINNLATTIQFAVKRANSGLVFFITHPKDRILSMEIIKKIPNNHILLIDQNEYSIQQMLQAASRLTCVVGTRYHELVMFASIPIPIIGIRCGDKVSPLFHSLEIPALLLQPEDLLYENGGEFLHRSIKTARGAVEEMENKVKKMKEGAAKGLNILLNHGYVKLDEKTNR